MRYGKRRLDNGDDPLRLEIADGIKDGAAILPVLLENARMPEAADLPPDVRPLADFNALRLRDGDWQHDLDNICKTLASSGFRPIAMTSPPSLRSTPSEPVGARGGVGVKGIIGAVLMLFALAAFGSDDLDHDGHVGVAVFAVVGLVLGVMTWRENRSQGTLGRIVGIAVSTVAVLAFVAALGGMESAATRSTSPDPEHNGGRSIPGPAPDVSISKPDELTLVPLLKGHAFIHYDPKLWRVDTDNRTEPGSHQYVHMSGEVYFKIITERLQLGLEQLAENGVMNARKADRAVIVTRQGSSRVNGLQMAVREFEVTINEMPLTFYVHYYSDRNGSIQLIGWTGRALIDEHRPAIEQFVNRFQVNMR